MRYAVFIFLCLCTFVAFIKLSDRGAEYEIHPAIIVAAIGTIITMFGIQRTL